MTWSERKSGFGVPSVSRTNPPDLFYRISISCAFAWTHRDRMTHGKPSSSGIRSTPLSALHTSSHRISMSRSPSILPLRSSSHGKGVGRCHRPTSAPGRPVTSVRNVFAPPPPPPPPPVVPFPGAPSPVGAEPKETSESVDGVPGGVTLKDPTEPGTACNVVIKPCR